MKKLSIIIAVYNIQDTIKKCLDSIVLEKSDDIEIIIVDDGSTDKSLQICLDYQKSDKRIKIIHQNNYGLSVVRNVGFNNSKGEYIWHIDGDDYLEKDYYKKIKPYLGKSDIICYNYYEVFHDVKLKNVFVNIDDVYKKYILNNCCVWNKIIKRDLLINERFPLNNSYNDIYIIPTLVIKAKKINFADEYIYNYVFRSDSISNNRIIKIDDLLICLKNVKNKIYEKYSNEVDCLYIDNLMISSIIKKYIRHQQIDLKYVNKVLKMHVPSYYKNMYWNDTLTRKIYIRLIYYNIFFIVKLMVYCKIKIYNRIKRNIKWR